MTNLNNIARAVSLTRIHLWGAEAAVLLHLAAEPTPFGVVDESSRDMAIRTGLGDGEVRRAISRLIARNCIVRDSGCGSTPNLYRVLEPREWGEVPWRIAKREAIVSLDASSALDVRAQDSASARVWARERRLTARALRRAGSESKKVATPRALPRGFVKSGSRAMPRAFGAPPSLSNSRQVGIGRDDLEGGSEALQLTEAQRRLLAAFFAGAPGLQELKGNPLHRLLRVASEANGSLDALVALAGDITIGGRWLDRVRRLEIALVAEPEGTSHEMSTWPPARPIREVLAELDAGLHTPEVARAEVAKLKTRMRATRAADPSDTVLACSDSESACGPTA